MKEIVIVSRYPNSPYSAIEGKGYDNKKDAEKMIEVFKARVNALNAVQVKFNLDEATTSQILYAIGVLTIPDDFFKD